MQGMIRGIAATCLATFTGASYAQDMSMCLSIEDSAKRKECFRAVYETNSTSSEPEGVIKSKAGQSPATPVSAGPGKWVVETSADPMNDSETNILILKADSGSARVGQDVVLFIRCKNAETDLLINWSDYLGNGFPEVTSRIGSAEPVTSMWTPSTDKVSTFYLGNVKEFILKMMSANRFAARTTPYNESPVTAVFDTTGLANAIRPLRANCGW